VPLITSTYNKTKNKLEELMQKKQKADVAIEGFRDDLKRRKKKNKEHRRRMAKLLNMTFKKYMVCMHRCCAVNNAVLLYCCGDAAVQLCYWQSHSL
jgi:hypothetical protein